MDWRAKTIELLEQAKAQRAQAEQQVLLYSGAVQALELLLSQESEAENVNGSS